MILKRRKYRSKKIKVKRKKVKDQFSILLSPKNNFQIWQTFYFKNPKELYIVASPAHTGFGRFSKIYRINEKNLKGKIVDYGFQTHFEAEKWVKDNVNDFKKRLVQHKSIIK